MATEKQILSRVPIADNIVMFLSRGAKGVFIVRTINRVPHDSSKPDILKGYIPDVREGDVDVFVSTWPEIVSRSNINS